MATSKPAIPIAQLPGEIETIFHVVEIGQHVETSGILVRRVGLLIIEDGGH